MREVWLIDSENKNKAEILLKKGSCPECGSMNIYFDDSKETYVCECGHTGSIDDSTSRASIAIKSPGSLGFQEQGVFFIINCSEDVMKKVEKKLSDYGKKYENKEKVLEKYDEQEDQAIQGFGNILG